MTSRQAGRRISSIAAERRSGKYRRVGGQKKQAVSPKEKRRLLQLMACGSIFVLLVAVKLLLPSRMARLNETISAALQQNMDVKAVFSAVGKAVSGEAGVDGTLSSVYQAVFHPEQGGEALETAGSVSGAIEVQPPTALDSLREFREDQQIAAPTQEKATPQAEAQAKSNQAEVATLAYVLYSDQNLPENVSMEQSLLGFDYCTPVFGALSSGFGYREHPVEGEERFHYGVDIAADSGTDIACFADGTVTAVGESSSYGKYLIVEHAGGYATLYAHCSRITAGSGEQVKEGAKLAEVGETGIATGPHLHFELHRNSVYLNPIYYVSAT